MNTLLLHPSDTLFFRDGRPMSGSLAGHGAAWPLPTVTNAALHAALHRADLEDVHPHRQGRSSTRDGNAGRERKFGSLVTAGPFPVNPAGQWFFPRPADAQEGGSTLITLQPTTPPGVSNLPAPLAYSVASTLPPTKAKAEPWISASSYHNYLTSSSIRISPSDFLADTDFMDIEHSIGIGISAETGTQNGGQFYSAHSLRLREGWSLGTLAEAQDKINGDPNRKRDLLHSLFPNSGTRTPVIVGGQQRLCSVERHSDKALKLPVGPVITGQLVKWILLTPSIWPEIDGHHGGWLPSWIHSESGRVMLKAGDTSRKEREGRDTWRKRVAALPSIPAKLVAALTGKPIPVSGYALPNSADPDRTEGGAKSTHLAVPAGSVYYFECGSLEAASALAASLNWHGAGDATAIRCRRSTLMGEKGFGLGVCGTWEFHSAPQKPEV